MCIVWNTGAHWAHGPKTMRWQIEWEGVGWNIFSLSRICCDKLPQDARSSWNASTRLHRHQSAMSNYGEAIICLIHLRFLIAWENRRADATIFHSHLPSTCIKPHRSRSQSIGELSRYHLAFWCLRLQRCEPGPSNGRWNLSHHAQNTQMCRCGHGFKISISMITVSPPYQRE